MPHSVGHPSLPYKFSGPIFPWMTGEKMMKKVSAFFTRISFFFTRTSKLCGEEQLSKISHAIMTSSNAKDQNVSRQVISNVETCRHAGPFYPAFWAGPLVIQSPLHYAKLWTPNNDSTGWPPVLECTGMYLNVLKWKMYWKMYWKSPFFCTGKILYWKI